MDISSTNSASAKETISKWVEEYSDILFSWAYHKTSNKEIAEDLVQDTFLVAYNSFDKFKGDSSPKTWLISILNNKINDHYRVSYKKPTQPFGLLDQLFNEKGHWTIDETPRNWSNDDENHLLDDQDFIKVLQECLDRLPKGWFSAINLKFMEEKKGKEICQELGITDTNFWQILHRAKLQLRKCLEFNWFTT
ncbi:MAG: sigma-70 family RNA polymerase sigma factor [Flavobacteriales bacterium]|nr:sigma-70 family RNA polymerase sigma factor [Flavobacteriales bacterium]